MAIYKLLSIDETGKASYGHKSKLFVLSGIVIPEKLGNIANPSVLEVLI